MGKLVKCGECGKEISPKAKSCPHCGAPVKELKSFSGCSTAIIVIVLLTLYGAYNEGLLDGKPGDQKPATQSSHQTSGDGVTDKLAAYDMMEKFVIKRLKSPSTAKFPSVWDDRDKHVRFVSDHTYIITSWVDSQNGFGAMIRTQFTGKIREGDNGEWQLLSLNLDE